MLHSLSFCSQKPKNVCAKGTFTMGLSGPGEEGHGNEVTICMLATCASAWQGGVARTGILFMRYRTELDPAPTAPLQARYLCD